MEESMLNYQGKGVGGRQLPPQGKLSAFFFFFQHQCLISQDYFLLVRNLFTGDSCEGAQILSPQT